MPTNRKRELGLRPALFFYWFISWSDHRHKLWRREHPALMLAADGRACAQIKKKISGHPRPFSIRRDAAITHE
jgi:hypothetical protein